jgi:hypothetical protein
MGKRKIETFKESLHPEQRRFVDQKQIDTQLALQDWRAFLGKAAAYDAYTDKAQAKTYKRMVGWGIGAFFSLPIIFSLLANGAWFGLPVALIPGALAYRQYRLYAHYKQEDLINYLRAFLMPVLAVLQDKTGPKTKLRMALDMRILDRRTHVDAQTEKGPFKNAAGQTVRKRETRLYQPTYIAAQTGLADQTQLQFSVGALVAEVRETKKSSRGKIKTKTKHKHNGWTRLKMGFPSDRYRLADTQENLAERFPDVQILQEEGQWIIKRQQADKVKFKQFKHPGQADRLRAQGEPIYTSAQLDTYAPDPRAFLALVEECYQMVEAVEGAGTASEAPESMAPDVEEIAPQSRRRPGDEVPLDVWTTAYFTDFDHAEFDHETAELSFEDDALDDSYFDS